MSRKIDNSITEGSDNIFKDLGFANPELELKLANHRYKLFMQHKESSNPAVIHLISGALRKNNDT